MEKEEIESVVDSLVCPSFSTYSCNKLDDIADQVLRSQNDNVFVVNDDVEEDNDFEFVAFRKWPEGYFKKGNSNQNFPIFSREILTEFYDGGEDEGRNSGAEDDTAAIRISLRKLLIGEEKHGHYPSPSSSPSEDELNAIPEGTCCVWTPKTVPPSPGKCKKSSSTGSSSSSSSKRWKLLNLLRRSKSDGKESLMMLRPPSNSSLGLRSAKIKEAKEKNNRTEKSFAGKKILATVNGGERKVPLSAHEAFYLKKKEIRRRTNLPYKQELFGFGVKFQCYW